MIIIFCEHIDYTANEICRWLKYFNKRYCLITDQHPLDVMEIEVSNKKIKFILYNHASKEFVDSDKITYCYYRRGDYGFISDYGINHNVYENNIAISNGLKSYLKSETKAIKEFLDDVILRKKYIGSREELNRNKLIQLRVATEVGLMIPKTIITNNAATATKKFKKYKSIITKGINESVAFATINQSFFSATNMVKKKDMLDGESFFPSLFQENITKKFELRIFFFNTYFYAMAIFSQLDKKTKVDFRNYNWDRPNRMVPFNLPLSVLLKIKLLVNKLRLTTGSVDMVYTNKNEYCFLEVNPVGQFGMVSKPCNYYIEKTIAKSIAEYEKK
jgi:ATP-GRASP peptide maturase of grasp-with-spasm system